MHYNSISANNTCLLEVLKIEQCSSLKSFPSGKLPSTLKQLQISDGMELESISERMVHNTMLEYLSIDCDPHLKILPECLHNLTFLSIGDCPGLESFPERGLPMPNLKTLLIVFCENLKFLPNQMQNLKSLEYLIVAFCPGLVFFPEGVLAPNLKYLKIDDCENLKAPLSEWGFHRLTSLSSLSIWSVLPEMVSLSDYECLLPTSLTDLEIHGLESLASLALQNLNSLKRLYISCCPKLWSLGLPPTLASLNISECPILKERCLKEKGEHWPNIADIPNIRIDHELIH